ncbi:NAD(P)H-dependent oxidoreductase [uncultured Kriegella sp.]|mgnify:CR=1 FL=1|uniref:NADPH-dependent FMN reductase n=1 Tax=uncultured Kriegella sp. TaxID=1798910 RepID=UPI0030DA9E10|tara:strand:+ start:307001 stop:307534 length:534 start_codon:yes stop_codon:yes gene_type:complete
MATLLAFAGSNSSTSINFKLIKYTVSKIEGQNVQLLNLANFPFPMYSADYEREKGYSNSLVELKGDIEQADGLIISVNEHNSNPSAYFKNVLDWLSRLELKFLADKKVFLMSTSGGRRGGVGSLKVIEGLLPRFGAEVVETFSLPSFHDNFDEEKGISDADMAEEHLKKLNEFLTKI